MMPSTDFGFPPRVLRRWREERLTLATKPDGEIHASFRFEGSTCGNVPFNLVYSVRLEPAARQHRLIGLICAPAPRDDGHQRMCSYLESADHILATLRSESPLIGRPLHEVLHWRPATSPAGCVCALPARQHKWLAVLNTILFALTAPDSTSP